MPLTEPFASHRDGPSTTIRTARPRPGAVRLALALVYVAAVTVPWTGVQIGGSIGDLLLLLAAVALVFADLQKPVLKLPPWVWAMAIAVFTIGIANQFAPPSTSYLASRNELFNNYLVIHVISLPNSDIAVMVPLLFRLLLLPIIFGLAREHDARAPFRALMAFAVGTAISSAVAFTDSRGWTSIGFSLTGQPVSDRRAGGLTEQPNILAMTCVFALPLVVWQCQAAARRRRRILAIVGLILLLLGLFASRSRSGAVAAALAGAVAIVWLPQYRRRLPLIGLALTVMFATLFVLNPNLGSTLLSGLRLSGGSTAGSDQARSLVNDQGKADFRHSPIHGIGFEIAGECHIVYLQALAVGGVLLLAGLLIYLVGALIRTARLTRVDPLAIPLFAAILGGAIFNALQNGLTPTFPYFATGIAASLPLGMRTELDLRDELM